METTPFVSAIVPCRNEEKLIGACLESLIANDYPKDKLEILVIDGISGDKTREIVGKYIKNHVYIKIFNNPQKIIPCAFNIGIKNAKGGIIMILSGHSTYEKDYISKCVKYSVEYDADNVGGILKILPRGNKAANKAIALVLTQAFGSGNAYVKIGVAKPRWADSASFGCFKREVFDRVGLFDERLVRGSDMDLNKRIRKAGGKILIAPDIVGNYYADTDFKSSWRHNFSDGLWTTYVLKYGSAAFSLRHLVPLLFVATLIATVILSIFIHILLWLFLVEIAVYLLASVLASVMIMIHRKERDLRYLFLLPAAFFVRHMAHGLGALWGIILPKK